MSEASLVAAGVRVSVLGGSATAAGLASDSGDDIIVPSSVFLPSLATMLSLTRSGAGAFDRAGIKLIAIPCHVQVLRSVYFLFYQFLLLILFELNSELTHIESTTFYRCSSLKSITIPQQVQFIDGSAFSTTSNLSISIASDNLHFVVKSNFILDSSSTQRFDILAMNRIF
jgi:hypothetical protein